MKTFATFFLAFLISGGLYSQPNNVLRGLVTLQNSNSQPAANVQITAFGTNAVYTNSSGQFELRFTGGKPGQTVRLIVQKESFHVLGPDPMVFETALRDDPDDLIRIVITSVQDFQNRVDRFMGSIDKRIKEQNNALNALREEQSDQLGEKERNELNEKIAQLYQQIADLEQSKEELSRQLAAIDLDQASGFAREALEKFEQGDLEGAMALMDKEKLDEYYENVLLQEEKLEKARRQAIENYMVLARMQRAGLQYEEAISTYREAIAKDSTNAANLLELGTFLAEINLDNEGFQYFVRALEYSRDDLQYLDNLTTVGSVLVAQNLPQLADSILQQANELSKRLGPQASAQQIKVLTSLGFLSQLQERLEESEKYLLEGITLCEPLFKADRELYFSPWVNLKINLSLLYMLAGDLERASEISLEVFSAYEQAPENRTAEQRLALGFLLNNMGHGLSLSDAIEQSDTLFSLAEAICLELERENYQAAVPLKSLVYNNIGMSLYNRGEFESAIIYLQEAYSVNLELSRRNPLRFQPMVGLTAGNLAMAEYNLGNYERAESYFENSFSAYSDLCEVNPTAFLPNFAQARENHLLLVADSQPIGSLIQAQFEYIKTLEELNRLFPGQFGEKIAYFSGETAWNQVLAKDFESAVKTARAGLKKDATQTWIYSVLAPALLLSGDYKGASDIYSKWKDEPYSLDETRTFREVFLEDIDTLEAEGNQSKDFGKVRKMLKM